MGPVMPDTTWQAREGHGFTASSFHLDWQAKQAICPQGKVSQFWWKEESGVKIIFAKADCATCPVRAQCTKSVSTGRMVKLLSQEAHEALQARRQEQITPDFRKTSTKRVGIEGTISQAVRRTGLRRARYDGLARVQVQHLCAAVAVNLVRLDAFFTGTVVGETRVSHFARLVHRLPTPAKEAA